MSLSLWVLALDGMFHADVEDAKRNRTYLFEGGSYDRYSIQALGFQLLKSVELCSKCSFGACASTRSSDEGAEHKAVPSRRSFLLKLLKLGRALVTLIVAAGVPSKIVLAGVRRMRFRRAYCFFFFRALNSFFLI